MAFNILIGLYVNTSATSVNSISGPAWSSMQPTFWTYPGNTSNKSFGGTGFTLIDTLFTDVSRGPNKYVLYLVDVDASGFNIDKYGQIWFHNDTSAYAHPDSPDANVNNGKYVWVYDQEAPPSYNYNGTSLPVFTYDCRFNMWQRSPNTSWDREFRSKFTTAVATLDYPDNGTGYGLFDGPGYSYGTSIVELYDTAPASTTKLLVTSSDSITTSSSGTYNQYYIYDCVSSSYTTNSSRAQTSVTYPRRVYVMHDGAGTSPRYHVGYIGNNNSSVVTVYHKNTSRITNEWASLRSAYNSNYLYLATTVSTVGQFIEYVLPVQLGRQYDFTVRARAATNNGIIISKTQITNPSGTDTLSNIGTSSDRITYAGDTTTVSNAIYKPTADGNVYVYYRTKSSGTLGASNSTGCAMGSVVIYDTALDFINVTFNKNEGSGGTNSQLILPGTAAGNYPSITLPTRSGYIFQGYYDSSTGGTLYYNSAGQGARIFDKVENCTLYAHWQQETSTVTITLNKNGGTGGQDTVSAVSGQYIGSVTVPSRTGFTFVGYFNNATHNSGTDYIDSSGAGSRVWSGSPTTLYAWWRNTIDYAPIEDGSLELTYSASDQTIRISNRLVVGTGTPTINVSGMTGATSSDGIYLTVPGGTSVGFYNLSISILAPTVTGANGCVSYGQSYEVPIRIVKATPTFELQGASVASGSTAQAKVMASVPGNVYWGTSSSSMTTTFTITSNTAGSLVSLYNATNSTAGTTVTIYAYFTPNDTANYNSVSTKTADLTVAPPTSNTIVITLNDNGGSGGSGSIVVEKNSSCSTWPSVSVPTRAGFTFMGYFTVSTATGGSKIYYESGSPYYGYSTSSNVTIYARWKVVITYPHYNKTSATATEAFVSLAAGEATSTTSAVTMQINGQINCVISSRTVSVTTSGKTNWTINSTGTTLTIPSGTSYCSGSLDWQIVVADGTYNGYAYAGNTVTQSYSWSDDYDERPYLYYNLKKVEYEKETSYPYNPIKFKAVNGQQGYNVTNAAIPGDGNTIYGPYYYAYTTEESLRYISTNNMTNNISWYQKYNNGTWDTTLKTGTEEVYGVWRIISETFTPSGGGTAQNITRSHATDTAVASQLLINGNYYTVYRARSLDSCFVHDSMEKQVGTDNIVVRIYNPSDPTKYTDITKSATNSLSDTKYTTSECTTQGFASLTKSNPTVTIGDGLTAAGGSGTITCICNDTGSWYQKYTSKAYEYYSNQPVTNPAWWRITSQTIAGNGTNRFTTPTVYTSNSKTLNIGGTNYTCFKTGENVSHSSMTSNVGNDVVEITAYREDDTTKVGTATKSISNILEPTHYSNMTCTTVGNKSSLYGSPSTVTIGNGLTAAGGSASITGGTCTDTFTYYQKYTSGTPKSDITTETVDSTITWSMPTHTFTPSGGSASDTDRFTLSGMTVNHTTMGTNAGTDKVTVRATNANSTSKYTTSTAKSISNSLGSQHYKDSDCTTTGENISTYGTPTASIGDGLTAGGGSATVTCTVNNTGSWYQKYTSGSVATYTNQSVSGTARWRITTNGNSRFSASGTGYTLSGIGTVYNTGTNVSHSTMGTYEGTDTVTITAYNIGSSSNTKTASKSVSNSLGTTKYKDTSGTEGYNITYNAPTSVTIGSGLSASGGYTTVTIGSFTNSTSWYQKYTSGSYTSLQTGTEAAAAKWRITDSDCDSGGFWANGTSSSLSIGGSTYTVYNSGAELRHSCMYITNGTDHVTVTAYNIGDTTKSKSAGYDVDNDVDVVHLNVKKTNIKYDEVTYCEAMAQYTSGCYRPVPSEDLTYTMGTSGKISITSTPATEDIYIQIDDFDDINYENEGYQSLTDWVMDEYDYTGYWYKYVEEIEYDGETYYLWAFCDYEGIDAYIETNDWHAYVITDTKNATTLYNYSLASTFQNLYVYPLVAVLNNDLNDQYWDTQCCIVNVQ